MPAIGPEAPAGGDAAGMRREPTQRRAKERVERILAVAEELIAQTGSDALRMSDVAKRAGVSIGSLYQYFPDKAAIVRTLAARYNAEDRACIEEELAGVQCAADLESAFARLVDAYYGLFLAEPVRRDIWSAAQTDKALQDLNLADDRENAALLAGVLERLAPWGDRAELATSAFLLWHLAGATVRLAISMDRAEGGAMVAEFKGMVSREIRRLLGG